jgi:hypothetical protein
VFVRWKRRPLRRRRESSPPDEHALSAVLVESHRVDGRPRQRVVRYLATIKEGQIADPLSTDRFWRDVDKGLAELELDDDQRRAFETRLEATVPRPDPALVELKRLEVDA